MERLLCDDQSRKSRITKEGSPLSWRIELIRRELGGCVIAREGGTGWEPAGDAAELADTEMRPDHRPDSN